MCRVVSALSLQALLRFKYTAKQHQCICSCRITREKYMIWPLLLAGLLEIDSVQRSSIPEINFHQGYVWTPPLKKKLSTFHHQLAVVLTDLF